MKKFLKTKEASEILGIHPQTLHKWSDDGKIESINAPNGYRLFNIEKFIKEYSSKKDEITEVRRRIVYCRVSTHGQKDDLHRQVNYMKQMYPDYELIKDIGSGINFKRKGFLKLIDYALKGEIEEIVVAHKDRLCRIGFDLVRHIVDTYSKGCITILHQINESPEAEVVKDLVQIINVFSARVNGLRKYRKKINKMIL
jgi:putative resolvase